MDERWIVIDGYPDYEVSDRGRVRRLTSRTCARAGTILKTPARSGYPCVGLSRHEEGRAKTTVFSVHRLVAAAFLGPANGREVNHINGIKTEPSAANLEYATRQENAQHSYRTGLQKRVPSEQTSNARLSRQDVDEIKRSLADPDRPTFREIGDRFGVTVSNISAIATGRSWA